MRTKVFDSHESLCHPDPIQMPQRLGEQNHSLIGTKTLLLRMYCPHLYDVSTKKEHCDLVKHAKSLELERKNRRRNKGTLQRHEIRLPLFQCMLKLLI